MKLTRRQFVSVFVTLWCLSRDVETVARALHITPRKAKRIADKLWSRGVNLQPLPHGCSRR